MTKEGISFINDLMLDSLGVEMHHFANYGLLISDILSALEDVQVKYEDSSLEERRIELRYWLKKVDATIRCYSMIGNEFCFEERIGRFVETILKKTTQFAKDFNIHDQKLLKAVHSLVLYKNSRRNGSGHNVPLVSFRQKIVISAQKKQSLSSFIVTRE